MRIGFYAPMKPIDHPVPSGDREFGRAIVSALTARGHDVRIASRFRSWCGQGGAVRQSELAERARAEADAVLARWRAQRWRPQVFVTYHLYHKAPDWIGPVIADALDCRYAIIEASRARKRQEGSWAVGFAAADRALARAEAVFAVHEEDAAGLAEIVPPARLRLLPPFIDAAPFAAAVRERSGGDSEPRLLAVAMMRSGDKDASYALLAEALARLGGRRWRLVIAGDGPARRRVLARFAPGRVTHLGAVARTALPAIYAGADMLLWPAVGEAFGLVFLEAQAAGLPVVAGAVGGVPAIVRHGETGLLVPVGDVGAFAEAVAVLMDDRERARRMGRAARAHVLARHDIPVVGQMLEEGLDALLTG